MHGQPSPDHRMTEMTSFFMSASECNKTPDFVCVENEESGTRRRSSNVSPDMDGSDVLLLGEDIIYISVFSCLCQLLDI